MIASLLQVVEAVSIPQSGFGAFEPPGGGRGGDSPGRFQSLSRDSGRLNGRHHHGDRIYD